MTDGPPPAGPNPDGGAGWRYARAPQALWRQVSDRVLVRTVADPGIVELSGTGVLLWLALAEPVSADELAVELAAVVGAPVDVVARDVRTALTDLVRRGVATQTEGMG